jgi:hypothetical protein
MTMRTRDGQPRTHLHMNGTGNDMAHEEIHEARLVVRQTFQKQREPRPEKGKTGHFEPKPSVARHLEGEETVRVGVKIEPCERENDVVDFVPANDDQYSTQMKARGLTGVQSWPY